MDFKELDKYIKAIKNVPHMIDAALEMCGQDSYDNYICRIRNFSEAYEELSKLDAEQILNEALINTDGKQGQIKKLLKFWKAKLYPNKYQGYIFDIDLKWGDLNNTYRKKLSAQGVLDETEADSYLSCLFRLTEIAEAQGHCLLDVINRLRTMAGIDSQKKNTNDVVNENKKVKTFADYLDNDDVSGILQEMHREIDNKSNSADIVRNIFEKAIIKGRRFPPYHVFIEEFGNVVGRTEYYRVRTEFLPSYDKK